MIIEYNYNINDQRWDFTFTSGNKASYVYMKPDLPESEIFRELTNWLNKCFRANEETSSQE